MSLIVNGVETPFPPGASLVDLLRQLEIEANRPGIAIAVNQEVVPRSRWSGCTLSEGDQVEIIHAVQGG